MKKYLCIVLLAVLTFGILSIALADKVAVESIELLETASVSINKTITLKPTVLPKNASNRKLTWSSSDETVATVNASGNVKGVSEGTAVITATANDESGVSASCLVTVVIPVKKMSFVDENSKIVKSIVIAPETAWGLCLNIQPEDATNKGVMWTSSNEKVATVDEKGTVTGVAKGSTTITATANDGSKVKATVNIKVQEFDIVITTPGDYHVEFETVESWYGSKMQIGNMVMGSWVETKIKIDNGCISSDKNYTLTPIKAGTDKITVTEKQNGKKVISKKTYSVFVAPSAFEIEAENDPEPV